MMLVVVAREDRGVRRDPPPVRARGRRRRRRSTSCSASSRPRCSRATPRARSRARASPPRSPTPSVAGQGHAVLRDARPALDLPPGLARLLAAPADLGLGQLRPRRVGALRPRARPRAGEEPRGRGARTGWPSCRACGSTTRASTTACRSTTAPRSSRCWPSARVAGPDRQQYTYYPDCADVPGVVRRRDQRPVVHDLGRRAARLGRRRGRALRARRRRRRAQPLREGPQAAVHVQLGRHHAPGRRRRHASSRRDDTSAAPTFTVAGPSHRSRRCPASPARSTLYIDDEKVGEGEIVTQPGYFCLVGDGICVGRDSASPVTPDYTAPYRVHRRHHRQGRRRRERRGVRRRRGEGDVLVREGLSTATECARCGAWATTSTWSRAARRADVQGHWSMGELARPT